MELKDRLRSLIREKALSYGKFTLSSGKESSYYLDCRTVTLHPEGLNCIAELFLERIENWRTKIDAIGGPMIGADPLVAGVVALSHLKGRPIEGFIVRNEPKKHGRMKKIEGNLKAGHNVALVDDVVTTGASLFRAIYEVESLGCSVALILSVVDRGEGGREAFKGKYDYLPIFDVAEITESRHGRDG